MEALWCSVVVGCLLGSSYAAPDRKTRGTRDDKSEIVSQYNELTNKFTMRKFDLLNESYKTGLTNITAGKEDFFWMTYAKTNRLGKPLIIRFRSQNSRSSILGSDSELWPFKLDSEAKAVPNEKPGWDSIANMMYIDSSLISNKEMKLEESVRKLHLAIYQIRKKNRFSNDIHIMGESEDAQVAALLTESILEGNKKILNEKLKIKSLILGDGVLDLESQVKSYSDMACNNEFSKLDDKQCSQMKRSASECIELIDNDKGFYECIDKMLKPFSDKYPDLYDLRQPKESESEKAYLKRVHKFLNNHYNKIKLGMVVNNHVKDIHYMNPNDSFSQPTIIDSLANILDANIPIFIYSGDADFHTNHFSQLAAASKISWSGQSQFQEKSNESLKIPNSSLTLNVHRHKNLVVATLPNTGSNALAEHPQDFLAIMNNWLNPSSDKSSLHQTR